MKASTQFNLDKDTSAATTILRESQIRQERRPIRSTISRRSINPRKSSSTSRRHRYETKVDERPRKLRHDTYEEDNHEEHEQSLWSYLYLT